MPNATAQPPERRQRTGADANALQGEYSTYAPKGEKCRKCHQPFASLEVVRRVQSAGKAANRPYVHVGCVETGGE